MHDVSPCVRTAHGIDARRTTDKRTAATRNRAHRLPRPAHVDPVRRHGSDRDGWLPPRKKLRRQERQDAGRTGNHFYSLLNHNIILFHKFRFTSQCKRNRYLNHRKYKTHFPAYNMHIYQMID